jgi:hypothetical protein
MADAVEGSRAGTLAASLAAAVSYGSLVVTEFRGFRQFGVIGGLGMVLSWGTAFLLVPSLCTWLDRGSVLRAPRAFTLMPLARLIGRASTPLAGLVLVLTAMAAMRVSHFGATDLETDFSKLRRADTWTRGEGYWGRRMDGLLQTYLTPIVVLADDETTAIRIGKDLKAAIHEAPLDGMVATVRTARDVLPADQIAKIEEVKDLREDLSPKVRSWLSDDDRNVIDSILNGPNLHAIGVVDLPRTFTLGLRERDGEIGRTVLVYPKPARALWNGSTIARFIGALRQTVSSAARPSLPARVAGSLPLSADILGAVRHDGPLASAVALVGVVLVVLMALRRRFGSLLLVVGALFVGVLWLGGLSMALDVKLNFANFIAYPITFGIGVDYSVNVVSRYGSDGARDILHAVATTGGAVALCSATTVIGYSSLLLAQNRGLVMFGLLAVLGEVCCLTAAVVALPACVRALGRG